MSRRFSPARAAFTLIELLVVIAIIGILIGLMVPAVQRVRESANRIKCANNVKQIALAVHSHQDQHHKVPSLCNWSSLGFPAANWDAGTVSSDGNTGTWLYHLLPFVDQQNLYYSMMIPAQTYVEAVPGYTYGLFPPYTIGAQQVIPLFICPSDTTIKNGGVQANGFGSTSYSGNVMVFNPLDLKSIERSMPDGTSNTVIIAERYLNCGTLDADAAYAVGYGSFAQVNQPAWAFLYPMPGSGASTPGFGWVTAGFTSYIDQYGGWMTDVSDAPVRGGAGGSIALQSHPSFANCNPMVTQTAHIGMQVGMGDGSVRSVTSAISVSTWAYACIPDDGGTLGSDW